MEAGKGEHFTVNVHYLPLPVYCQPRRAETGGESELSVGGAATVCFLVKSMIITVK